MTVRYARRSADVAPVNKNNTNALGFYLKHDPVAERVKLWYPRLTRYVQNDSFCVGCKNRGIHISDGTEQK